jgi:hypothetical protein
MKAILSIVFFFSVSLVIGQTSFPSTWVGDWSGKLEIFNVTGKLQELPMELHIHPLDTVPEAFTFAIVYGEDKVAGLRAYELVTVDAAKGRYLMDEKNSIKMEAYYVNGKLALHDDGTGGRGTTLGNRFGQRHPRQHHGK